MRLLRSLATLLSLGLALAAPAALADDTAPPQIEHTPVDKAEKGKQVRIQAKITDESKFFPQVFYRWDGAPFAKPVDMKKGGGKDIYRAAVPGKGGTLEYYIEAYDEFGNGPARSGTPEAPHKVEATAAVAEKPKAEPKAEEPPKEEAKAEPPKEEPKAEEPPKAEEHAKEEPKAEPPKEEPKADAPPKEEKVVEAKPKKPRAPSRAVDSAPESGARTRTWTWVVGGTGAGLLLGGLLTGMGVKKADDAYAARLAQDRQTNPSTLQQQYDANKSIGTTATIMTLGGLVLLGGGTALYFLEGKDSSSTASNDAVKDTSKVQFAATPVNGGAAAVIAGKF